MAFRVIVVFLVLASVICDDDEYCNRGPMECDIPKSYFPGNQEEFEEVCASQLEYFRCAETFENKCYAEDDPQRKKLQKFRHGLNNVCDNNSSLHRALSKHITCIRQTYQTYNQSCDHLEMETRKSSILLQKVKKGDHLKMDCLGQIVNAACILEKIGLSCGLNAERTTIRTINALKEAVDFCGGTNLVEIAELAEVLLLEDAVKIRILSLLDFIKE